MGILCLINLYKPPDGAFFGGEVVSGMIKYALDVPMEVEKITISLKGVGYLVLVESTPTRTTTYARKEVYVDTNLVLHEGKYKMPAGPYELKFNLRLPQNIPPSFKYHKTFRDSVKCGIKYYVRIRFDRPGLFGFTKHFRKEITVASTVTPKLLMEPTIYGKRGKLLQLFTCKTSMVIMKAKIHNPVIPNGGRIEIQSEIQNDTNVIVKSVTMKLIEVYTFKTAGIKDLRTYKDVPNCETKTTAIQCGATQNMSIDIIVPLDKISLENSNIVARDYILRIIAELPMPHRNVVLEIPVQIGNDVQRDQICDPPPTYWETMGETTKDDDASDDEV